MRTEVIARRISLRRRPAKDPVTPELRLAVYERDQGCVGAKCFDGRCEGRLELDHVRSSGALGLRSRSTLDNLVALCTRHHRWKTEHGREARPILLAYLEAVAEPVCRWCGQTKAVHGTDGRYPPDGCEWDMQTTYYAPVVDHSAHVDPCGPTCQEFVGGA